MPTTLRLTPLEETAESLGVRVRTAPVPAGLWGVYDHPYRLITLKPGLGSAQRRSTLAHELGHAYYGHRSTRPKQERAADLWAARALLDPVTVAEEARYTPDPRELAAAFDVLPWVIGVFVDSLSELELRFMLEMIKPA